MPPACRPPLQGNSGASSLSFRTWNGEEELRTVPGWRAHRLPGDRRETWSLAVTANWRLTFRIDREEMEIVDLDYEDYH